MSETQKSSAEQIAEIQKLIEDAEDRLTQAKWALKTLLRRLEALEETNGGRS